MQYIICHPALSALESKVGALVQQAVALNHMFSLLAVQRTTSESAQGVITDQVTVDLKGDRPEIEGWAVIAALQFDARGQVQVNAVPDCGVPERFLHAPTACGHCAAQTSELLVLRNLHTGACLPISRSCVAAVLGATGPATVQYADLLIAADAAARQAQGYEIDVFSAERYAYRLDKYLAQVARQIALNGWVSRKQAETTGQPPTSELALDALFAVHDVTPDVGSTTPGGPPPDGGYGQTAQAAIAWARQLALEERALSDYERRLHEIAQQDTITYGETGLAASLLQAHHSAAQRAIERQLTDRPSRHFGQVSERLTVTLLVLNRTEIPKPDGVTVLYKFVDPANGNRAAWFASADPQLEIGATYHLKATVIRHSEFRGTAETILNRCKVLAPSMTQIPLAI